MKSLPQVISRPSLLPVSGEPSGHQPEVRAMGLLSDQGNCRKTDLTCILEMLVFPWKRHMVNQKINKKMPDSKYQTE